MDTAIVKLDTLSDTVGSSAQDHDLRFISTYRILIGCIVCGIIICAVLRSADMNAFPGFLHTKGYAMIADILLGNLQQLTQILVGEAVLLGTDQHLILRHTALTFKECFLFLHQFLHLLNKIGFYLCDLKDFLYRSTLTEGFIHKEMTFT